jgi:hypothetical protein
MNKVDPISNKSRFRSSAEHSDNNQHVHLAGIFDSNPSISISQNKLHAKN